MKKLFAMTVAVMMVISMFAACGGGSSASGRGDAIKIGLTGPFTGDNAGLRDLSLPRSPGYYAAKPGFHADVVPSALYPERAGQQGPVFSVSLRGLTGLSSPPSSQ